MPLCKDLREEIFRTHTFKYFASLPPSDWYHLLKIFEYLLKETDFGHRLSLKSTAPPGVNRHQVQFFHTLKGRRRGNLLMDTSGGSTMSVIDCYTHRLMPFFRTFQTLSCVMVTIICFFVSRCRASGLQFNFFRNLGFILSITHRQCGLSSWRGSLSRQKPASFISRCFGLCARCWFPWNCLWLFLWCSSGIHGLLSHCRGWLK